MLKELKALVGQAYSPEICEPYNWSGFYPVVSQGKIIAIYDCASQEPAEYARLPVIDDQYMSPDDACIMVERSDNGCYSIPGAAEVESWDNVRGAAQGDYIERMGDLTGWGIWNAVYRLDNGMGDVLWYFVHEEV